MKVTKPKPQYYAMSITKPSDGLEAVKAPDGFYYLYYDALEKRVVFLTGFICAN